MVFYCKKSFVFAIYAVFRKIGLLQFTRYCVEKILAKISDRGEKLQISGMCLHLLTSWQLWWVAGIDVISNR